LSEPSAYEQYLLELVNAARAKGGVQPLANNRQLNDAADTQVSWMISNNILSHTGAGGSSPYDRMVDAGFVFSGSYSWGENMAWESLRGAAGYTDEVKDLHNWLMNSSGHYANIMKASYTQVGIGFSVGPFQGWQSAVAVEDFVATSQHFLTGVAYNDTNGDHAYEPGEGLGGLTVTAIGSTGGQYVTHTYGSGGYDLALAAGTYTVTFSGSNLPPLTRQVTVGSVNVKLDLVDPGAANPTPEPTVTGTSGADTLTAAVNTGPDTLSGLGGDDRLTGGGGNDLLDGGTGGDDLYGDAGADTLVGGDGADLLQGGSGSDRMDGGAGSDAYYVDSIGDVVVETLSGTTGGTADKVYSSVGYTLGANVERLTLTGSASIDGAGNALANVIYGNSGDNELFGYGGADILSGGAGADTLNGGAGADTMTGGSGADRFVFAKGQAGGDRIADFGASDVIVLTGYSAGSTLTKVSGSSTDWLIQDHATGATEVLKLANAYVLGAGDFLFS